MKTDAVLSNDRKYRYVLTREWDENLPKVMFVGLNPSTADEIKDDPTIRRCISFAKEWGYGGFYMVNLFAFRSKNPSDLWREENPIGIENDDYIKQYVKLSDKVVACWGEMGSYLNRSKKVLELLDDVYCLIINKSGEPKHPLYIKAGTPLIRLK
ncbi:TPA: DUF1643 domain-containing protein [Streptococcus suis]|uniref:DUF1643 domain-containing protein n=1 Tax=Streptococcus suis TaxID=1307 RepID=UPI000462B778|nr:DUF1643 domain-containing protein [Streptococcus suis]HEM3181939.1 DUF1643 domain-containing protein [Streptococcus suis 89-5259]